jgi:hypothetical protein
MTAVPAVAAEAGLDSDWTMHSDERWIMALRRA